MKVGIMQPYYLPYIGYFQLASAVDKFIVYDRIEYTKKGWINRNRILSNGTDKYFTLPLKKDSDYLNVNERYLADSWESERKKIIGRIKSAYQRAPYFDDIFPLIEQCLFFENFNLFEFVFNSLRLLMNKLQIRSELIRSSDIETVTASKGAKRVIQLCHLANATTYINPIGGVALYSQEYFRLNGIQLCFLRSDKVEYRQFGIEFVPNLSIIDVLMFNPPHRIAEYLNSFDLI